MRLQARIDTSEMELTKARSEVRRNAKLGEAQQAKI